MKEKGSIEKWAMEAAKKAGNLLAGLLQHGVCSKN